MSRAGVWVTGVTRAVHPVSNGAPSRQVCAARHRPTAFPYHPFPPLLLSTQPPPSYTQPPPTWRLAPPPPPPRLQVIRGNYDPMPATYSEALRKVVASMLVKRVKDRPDANQLLTDPFVVPHVQVRGGGCGAGRGGAGCYGSRFRSRVSLGGCVHRALVLWLPVVSATGSLAQLQGSDLI